MASFTWYTQATESPELSFGRDCCPTHIHQIGVGSLLEGVPPLVSALVHLPVLLDEPGPSGSAGPSRRCRSCSYLPLRLQDRAAPSFSGLLRQPKGEVPFTLAGSDGASWRLYTIEVDLGYGI